MEMLEINFSSAGGLVTAVAPVVVESQGTWVIKHNQRELTLLSIIAGWLDRPARLLSFSGRDSGVHISKPLSANGWTEVGPNCPDCHQVEDGF